MKKTAVIFPGIGYHADKPLLYYAAKLAVSLGYEVIKIEYPFCSVNLLEADEEQLRSFTEGCVEKAAVELKEKLADADDILFISKSIGTAVAAASAGMLGCEVRHILFTPLKDTFAFVKPGSGTAFNGTNDSWADWKLVKELCEKADIPLTTFKDANHSLETGDVAADLAAIQRVMTDVKQYINTHK